VKFLEPYRKNALKGHPWQQWAEAGDEMNRRPGMQSRWSSERICRGSRCAPSSSWKSPMITCRATGSGTPAQVSAVAG
jgi:hypothetical protein